MSQFYSELISEGDKLTIRSYKNNFCVKMSLLYLAKSAHLVVNLELRFLNLES